MVTGQVTKCYLIGRCLKMAFTQLSIILLRIQVEQDKITTPLIYIFILFLVSFEKLGKMTISFIMSVCPSTSNNSAPPRGTLVKFDV